MRSIVNYKPVSGLDLADDFDRMFNGFFGGWDLGKSVLPKVDISETGDAYLLEADLPGIAEKDLNVKVENDVLTISSETKAEENKKDKSYLVRERSSRSFVRTFVLPKDADKDNITAEFKKGVLYLSMPKSEAAKPRNIEIKSK